jgi:cytochrome c-type biogenesis protein CcmF
MNSALGTAGVTIAVASSLLGAGFTAFGLVRKRPRFIRYGPVYAWFCFGGMVLAVIAMQRALITRDFSLAYVAKVGSSRTPRLFNIAAMWTSLEGSILLWGVILAGFTTAVTRRFRRRITDPLVGWALVTMLSVSAFFYVLMSGPANPFRTLPTGNIPLDGPGPNPLLQEHLLVAFHPPMLYLGYVGFTVPFAFAIGALVTGRVGEGWLLETRRWTLLAWGFLTFGIVLGAWWSYEVLGWNGFWAWDAVENASFLPWLTGTAFIHSVLVQERRGMLRVWNLALLCATFALTILGTFLTRSGVTASVHAFSDSAIGPWLLTFFGLIVAVTLGLMTWRGDRLRSPGAIDAPVSREGAFMLNNLLFTLFAFVVMLGTVFPIIIEALQDRQLTIGRPYFDNMTMPIGLALLTLMAIAPVLPWRKASTELLRDRLFWPAWCGIAALALGAVFGRGGVAPLLAFGLGGFALGAAGRQLVLATRRQGWRGLVGRANGGMVVHVGVIILAMGFAAANAYARTAEFTLKPGESASFGGHTLTYVRSETVEKKSKVEAKAIIAVDGDEYAPAQVLYRANGQVTGRPSVDVGVFGDVYLSLNKKPATDGTASLQVVLNPMVAWLWFGGLLMAVGTVLAAFPGRRRKPTDPVSAALPDDNVPVVADEPVGAPA